MTPRKITNKGTKKVIGKFPSLKLKKMVWWESQIERDYIYLLEFDPGVLFYKEQPSTISYSRDGKHHHYTPDFLVERPYKKQIVEVKPEDHLTKEKNELLFRSVAPLFNQEGYEFIVVTDAFIRTQPRMNNINYDDRLRADYRDRENPFGCDKTELKIIPYKEPIPDLRSTNRRSKSKEREEKVSDVLKKIEVTQLKSIVLKKRNESAEML